MDNGKKIASYVALACIILCSFLAGYYSRGGSAKRGSREVTVETIRDTIVQAAPKVEEEASVGTERYRVKRVASRSNEDGGEKVAAIDSLYETADCAGDSVDVELPIVQRRYSEADYEAWVSGPVDPRLDSIKIYRTTNIVTAREREAPRRWHIGVTGGYGYTPGGGFEPYIGVGVMYSIISI